MDRTLLAKLSCVLPVAAMAANFILRPRTPPVTAEEQGQAFGIACTVFVAYAVGLGMAVAALWPRAGQPLPRDVKWPAVAGLVLNGLFLVAAVVIIAVGAGGR